MSIKGFILIPTTKNEVAMNEKKKILIIDDDEKYLITTKEILEDEGYEVYIQHRPIGSTNAIKRLKPDLVLLDINMPALSGDKLSTIILSQEKDAPIVFYSSNDEDYLRRAVSECGVNGYICKGNIYELRRRVAYYIGQNRDEPLPYGGL